MEQNVLPFIQDNIFSNIKIEQLNAAEKRCIVGMAKEILEKDFKPGKVFTDPKDTKAYLQLDLQDLEHEVFGVICLTQRHHMISNVQLFRGTLDGASVYCREVVKHVLEQNSGHILIYHNHPSGYPNPSDADKQITRRLVDALRLVDVRILDHIVVAKSGTYSFAEQGLL